MVAYQGYVGHTELVHDVALPQKLVRHAEVAHVTAVDNEVDVIALVYLSHEVQRFVVPALRVAHGHELNRCLVLAFLLYLRNIMGVYIGLAVDAYIIRMIVYHVATAHKQAEE